MTTQATVERYKGYRIDELTTRGTTKGYVVFGPAGGPMGQALARGLPDLESARRRVDKIIAERGGSGRA